MMRSVEQHGDLLAWMAWWMVGWLVEWMSKKKGRVPGQRSVYVVCWLVGYAAYGRE